MPKGHSSFGHSAMDGYALKFEDTPGELERIIRQVEVIEDLPAGFVSEKDDRERAGHPIMTGAPIPKGADTVIPVEETKKEMGLRLFSKQLSCENIRRSVRMSKRGNV